MQKILPKKDFPKFINNLIQKYEVIAPVKSGTTKFQKIQSAKEIYIDEITKIPAKTHFIPENETLLKFKNNKAEETTGKIKKTILFGLRKCDLNAIQIIDKVMYDKQYLNKEKTPPFLEFFVRTPTSIVSVTQCNSKITMI